MRPKYFFLIITFLISLGVLAACTIPTEAPPQKVPTALPTELPTEIQTQTPVTASPGVDEDVITPSNAARLEMLYSFEVPNVNLLKWSQDSKVLETRETGLDASGNSFAAARFFQIDTREQQAFYKVDQPVRLEDLSPDGRSALLINDNGTRIEWRDLRSDEIRKTIEPGYLINTLSFNGDGSQALVSSADEFKAELYDLKSGKKDRELTGFETAAPVYSVLPGADGRTMLWVARGTLMTMDLANGSITGRYGFEDFIMGKAISPDGRWLAVAAAGTIDGDFAPRVYLFDAGTNEQTQVWKTGSVAADLAFSPDGRLLFGAAGDQIEIWSLEDFAPVASLACNCERINQLAISPDGKKLAFSTSKGEVVVCYASKP